MKKIVLVTSSQPSLNPRLVKEADALAEAGYEVVVIGQYWNAWAQETDKPLLASRSWKFIQVGGRPDKKLAYFFTRLIHKITCKLRQHLTLDLGIAELSVGRCTIPLYLEAKRQRGDLYIGHNPGGLAPAIRAAKKLGVKCGFDAEDFHRHEYSDDPNHPDARCKKYLEEKYFPKTNYLTAASPLIAAEYDKYFPSLKFIPILNVFPKPNLPLPLYSKGSRLKLFWFSQTLGHNRGIGEIIQAIGICKNPDIELHLLANPRQKNIHFFNNLAAKHGLQSHQVIYHNPVSPETLYQVAAQYDIGLASETGFNTNNNLALSNKLFTYIASGLAVLYSNTPAQEQFMQNYPACGLVYEKNDPSDLAAKINYYFNDRQALDISKRASLDIGHVQLNWETESQKFLSLVKKTLTD